MLQTMRNNAQGMVAKIIIGFLILVFGLWGVESIVSIGGGEQAAVEVDGQKISEQDITRAIDQQRANLSRQFGDQFNSDIFNDQFLRQAAIEQLVNEKITVIQAQKLGLKASNRSVDETILTIPAFQVDGRFDKEQFQNVLRLNGMTPLSFRDALASDIVVNQAQAAFALSSFATPFTAKVSAMLAQEERTFAYQEFNAKELESSVKITDEDIQRAYDANQERFRVPEMASVNYIELTRASIAAKQTVTEAELQTAYKAYQQQSAAAEQRQASHILLETHDRSLKEAKELAANIKQRLAAGEDFAALAKEYSDDLSTKDTGGDLGITPRGSFDDTFENALYALPEGAVSDPVETEYGVHLIKASKIIKAEVKSFADMKPTLEKELRDSKSYQAYNDKIAELSDLSFRAKSLDDLAAQAALPVQQTALFSREQGEGIAEQAEVRDTAFSSNVLFDRELSSVIELPESAVIIAIKQHNEESVKPLADVLPVLTSMVKQEKAQALAKERAEALVANTSGAKWQTQTTTYSQATDAPCAVQQRAFAMSKGQVEAVATQAGYAVVKLDAVKATPWQQQSIETKQVEMDRLQQGRGDLFSYQSWSRAVTPIKRAKNS